MNYGGIVPAPKEPGLLVQASLTQPRPLGPKHCLELRQDNTMWASEGKKKKKKKAEEEKYWKFPVF